MAESAAATPTISGSDPASAATTPAPPVVGATGAGSGPEGAMGATAAEGATGTKGDQESVIYRAARRKEAENVQREQRFAQTRAQADAREKAIADREKAFAEREKLFDEDPLAYAVKHKGYRDEDLARRFLGDGKPSPQEQEARREAKHAAEMKELRDRIDARDKAEREQGEARARSEHETKVRTDFAAFTEGKATVFPRAAAMLKADADETVFQVNSIAQRLIERGDARRGPPLWEAALGHYDSHLSKLGGTVTAAGEQSSTQGSEKPGQPGHKAESETAPTLSGKSAAKRSTVPNTSDPLALELSDPEASRQHVIGEIRKRRAARKTA
jgi:hypothetical protein